MGESGIKAVHLPMILVKVSAFKSTNQPGIRQKGVRCMKGTFKMQDEETIWFENYEPVQEYLEREFSRKSASAEKDPKKVKFSWLEIMKKSFHNK